MSARKKQGKAWIGTSGWIYRHWANGVFYPPRLPQREWLPYFMQHFQTVEINASFYRLPNEAMATRWSEVAPAHFRYAIKLWRMVTHMKKLKDCAEPLDRFLSVLEPLGRRRGPLLVQLPPGLKPDPARLEGFLDDLEHAMTGRRWKVAVEFRNNDWLIDPVLELLDKRKAAHVLHDIRGMKVETPGRADFVYIRRHGSTGGYHGEYTPEQIEHDAGRIRGWLDEGRDVWVYYNNDIGGAAVSNAKQLIEALGS